MNTQERITALLKPYPGLTAAQLTEMLELNDSTVRSALKKLEAEGEVTKTDERPATYHLTNTEEAAEEAPENEASDTPKTKTGNNPRSRRGGDVKERRAIADERDQRVLAFLKKNGPSTRRELAEALDLTYDLTYISLWRLKNRSDAVEMKRTGTRSPAWAVKASA